MPGHRASARMATPVRRRIITICHVPGPDRLSADQLKDVVVTFRDTIRRHQSAINRLNVYPVPDGDTGTNMARTLDAVVAEIEVRCARDGSSMASVCGGISHGALMGARGNSGVILSQVLRGLAATFVATDAAHVEASVLADGFSAASKSAYEAVLKPIEGTILTVVRESADAAVAAADGGSLETVVRAARSAGGDALRRTPDMLPVLKQAGVVDAGGAGFLLLLDSFLNIVTGEPLPEPDESGGPFVRFVVVVMVPAVMLVGLAIEAGKVTPAAAVTVCVLIVSTSTFCVTAIVVLVKPTVVVGLPTSPQLGAT